MNNIEFCEKLKNIANSGKTLYVHGAFGWTLNDAMKERAKRSFSYNRNISSKLDATPSDYFGFDCVCLVKAVLWGFNGDITKNYGGAVYQSNNVPDYSIEQILSVCSNISGNFENIEIGEFLYMPGHCGIYIGDGLAVEATPSWDDGVQITAVRNILSVSARNSRTWKMHGKLPYIEYIKEEEKAEDVKIPKTGIRNPYKLNMESMRKGCTGEDVKSMQILLISRGYNCGKSGADGDFGNDTERAVRAYQTDCEIVVDGIAGLATMSRLLGRV